MRQTTYLKPATLEQRWRHVDAAGKRVGRLAAELAVVLQGKHRPDYTPHIDCGDYIVVTNVDQLVLTGRKSEQKMRKHYTGYPGGLKLEPVGQVLETRPERVLEDAVRRMLPKGRLGRTMIQKLKCYRGPEHPHAAQQPEPLQTKA